MFGLDSIFQMSQGAVDSQLKLELMKKGKTDEQKRVIDFFLSNGGCGCLGKSFNSPMSMETYIKMVEEKILSLNVYQRALERIGLDESQISEINPIAFTSFVFDDSKDLLIKSDTNATVSNKYSVTWIFFSSEQIFVYKYLFDMASDNTWEYTRDYFYSDIISFSTSKRIVEKIRTVTSTSGCIFKKSTESYLKNNYVVDRFEIVTAAEPFVISMRNSEGVEQSIFAARAMLREKKYSK